MSIEDKFLVQDTKQTTFHRHNGVDSPQIRPKDLAASFTGYTTYNPASLSAGAGATTTVTVKGVTLGDIALASFSLDLQGITLTAYVSAADTVSVRFQNQTSGTIDLGNGTLKVISIRI